MPVLRSLRHDTVTIISKCDLAHEHAKKSAEIWTCSRSCYRPHITCRQQQFGPHGLCMNEETEKGTEASPEQLAVPCCFAQEPIASN